MLNIFTRNKIKLKSGQGLTGRDLGFAPWNRCLEQSSVSTMPWLVPRELPGPGGTAAFQALQESQQGRADLALWHRFSLRWDHKEGHPAFALCHVTVQAKWSWCAVNPWSVQERLLTPSKLWTCGAKTRPALQADRFLSTDIGYSTPVTASLWLCKVKYCQMQLWNKLGKRKCACSCTAPATSFEPSTCWHRAPQL